jgi:hypothetical protein
MSVHTSVCDTQKLSKHLADWKELGVNFIVTLEAIPPCTYALKSKVIPVLLTEHDAVKEYWGSGGVAPLILWPRH